MPRLPQSVDPFQWPFARALLACAATVMPINVAAAQAQWNLVEELRIGTGESDPQTFADIRGVAVGTGGRIFVLAPNANELTLFAADPELVGIDGIAFAADGEMYINNVRKNLVQRVERDGSRFTGLTTLTLSEPVNGPDALRPVGGNRFLQAEGPGNRVTYVDIEGDRAVITPVRTGLDSSPGVTHVGQVGYATEGKIGYLFDPNLRDKDPGPFIIRVFRLP